MENTKNARSQAYKRLSTIFLFFLFSFSAFSQLTPKWKWATRILANGNDELHSIVTDSAGNIYVAGEISSGGWKIILGPDTFPADGYHEGFFISKFDSTGKIVWGKPTGGGIGYNGANSMAIDNKGNLYVCGYSTSASVIFGKDTLKEIGKTQFPQKDIVIVKYDLDGNVIWAKRGGSLGDESADAICIGSDGNIYIAGKFSRRYSFNLDSFKISPGIDDQYDIYWLKMDADGNIKWLRNAGGNNNQNEIVSAIEADENANLYITGYFESEIFYFGSKMAVNSKWGKREIFVMKFDSAGNDVMALRAGGTENDEAFDITLDKRGCIYVAGYTYGMRFANDSIPFNKAGATLMKFAVDGTPLWARTIGESQTNIALSVSVDSADNAVIAGFYTTIPIIVGKDTLQNHGLEDIFIAKYDSAGNIQWAKGMGYDQNDVGTVVHIDHKNDIYLGGENGSFGVAFDSIILSSGSPDIFLAKLKFVAAPDITEDTTTLAVQHANENRIKVYPNPCKNYIYINHDVTNVDAIIINVMGNMTYSEKLPAGKQRLNISHLTPGIYTLVIKSSTSSKIIKFTKTE